MEASAFFLGVAAFLGVVVFFVVAFLAGAAGLAGPLVTRPDLVLPSTFSTSTTAGAWWMVSHGINVILERYLTAAGVLRLVAVLALAFGVVVFLVLVAFLGAAVALAGVFFGAAAFFVAAGALGVVVFFGKHVSECAGDVICSWNHGDYTPWEQRA